MATITESGDKIKACLHRCKTYEQICMMEDMIARFKVAYKQSPLLTEELFYIELVLHIRKEIIARWENLTPYNMSDIIYSCE